jgi:hypothetical protein
VFEEHVDEVVSLDTIKEIPELDNETSRDNTAR